MNDYRCPILAAALLCLLSSSTVVAAPQAARPSLVPLPGKLEWSGGFVELSQGTEIYYGGDAAKAEAETLAAELRPATGLPLPIERHPGDAGVRSGSAIALNLDAALSTTLGKEGYRLEVSPQWGEVRIIAAAPAGLFYGGQTIRQLLPTAVFAATAQPGIKWKVPGCHIEDKPRMGWRGYMLDYSRHFLDKQYTRHLLDAMAMHKLNVLHMHLADDDGWRIEIKKYPRLIEIGAWRGTACRLPNTRPGESFARYGGYFTQDDIRELVDYAARRHINIMPELDMPGHSLALCTAYPATLPNKFPGSQSPQGTVGNVLSPAKESNYAMIDDILGELATIFPFDYIHIGGDEVNHDIWSQDPEIKEFMAREKIASLHDAQVYFTARLEKILARRHKRMIGWNEILNDKLQRTTGIMSWTGIGPGYQAARLGFPVVMAPAQHNYFDMVYPAAVDEPAALDWAGAVDAQKCYAFDPLGDKSLSPQQAAHIFGVHGCLWSEMIFPFKSKSGWLTLKTPGETADYKTFPRLCALAEMGWTPQAKRDYADFNARLGPHLGRLKTAGIGFRVPPPRANVKADRVLSLLPPFPHADVRFTLDGSDPLHSPTAMRLEQFSSGMKVPLMARTFVEGMPSPLYMTH